MNSFQHPAAAILSSSPYFAGLAPQALEAVACSAVRRQYETGALIFLEGAPCAGLGFAETGRLKGVKISSSGREQILNIFNPGEIFNVASVFASDSNPITVIALEPSVVWFIPRDALFCLLDRYPALTRGILRILSLRVLDLVKLVEDLSLRTVEMRLARTLLERAADEVLYRESWATQTEMAARLGTVTFVLNRALRSLEEAGLITVERNKIEILDREGLKIRAECR